MINWLQVCFSFALKFKSRRYTKDGAAMHSELTKLAAEETAKRSAAAAFGQAGPRSNRPISVYCLGKMPIQSCGQSVSTRRRKRYTEIGLLPATSSTRNYESRFLSLMASYDIVSNTCLALRVGSCGGGEWAG
jgi:hypothetical protein